ncbi:putative oxidoreductase [Lachnellula subtilissima]|uniref:Putative oxidoreductase n=1 Tax=Lachnellula subtilissima TaxID=602034 RepID=A0A8H8RPW5_9HELO|nr:putative oxidoreductase [Lachnellula subtilissima]
MDLFKLVIMTKDDPARVATHAFPCNDNPITLKDDLLASFQVNVIGLINTVTAFIPLIHQGTAKKVIAISSGMGDTNMVNEISVDVAAPYAISKAGVNMVIAKYNALYSKQGVLFMAICPGSVATSAQNPANSDGLGALDAQRLNDLGAKFASYAPSFKGPVSPEEAVRDIMSLVYGASLEKGDGGSFVSHRGTKRWI